MYILLLKLLLKFLRFLHYLFVSHWFSCFNYVPQYPTTCSKTSAISSLLSSTGLNGIHLKIPCINMCPLNSFTNAQVFKHPHIPKWEIAGGKQERQRGERVVKATAINRRPPSSKDGNEEIRT
uniref:Uncharacterized protein n=2 Tax=Rhizophora mucronata TaxID=61149 RepID=A0A2P2JVF5_RHIMU